MRFYILYLRRIILLFLLILVSCDKCESPNGPNHHLFELKLESVSGLKLQITSPEDGAKVEWIPTVKGTVSGLPEEYEIKVLVHPHKTDLWYPQQTVSIKTDLSWNTTVYLGLERESGDVFDIGAIAVTGKQLDIFNKDTNNENQYKIIQGTIPAMITVTRL
jgi:hypothetical protein